MKSGNSSFRRSPLFVAVVSNQIPSRGNQRKELETRSKKKEQLSLEQANGISIASNPSP
jgi:hypothetical protein